MRRRSPPFECEIVELGPRGVGLGRAPDGRGVEVRFAPPGSRLALVPTGRSKRGWTARRAAMIRPPAGWAEPRCAQFALCGGCALQELALPVQRRLRVESALAEVARGVSLDGVTVHEPRGTDQAYGYRNKVELAFGPTRFLREQDHAAGLPTGGRFLGFHAPERFDRVVDAPRCELVSERANGAIAAVRGVYDAPGAPEPWDPHGHVGFWRHLVLREGSDGLVVVLYTGDHAEGERWAAAVADAVAPWSIGFQWRVNLGVADVARGDLRMARGEQVVTERLGGLALRLSPTAFFQVNPGAARILYETVRDALGRGGVLLDLYCGVGAIGLFLASGGEYARVLGLEENAAAVEDARANAAANGIDAEFVAAKVEEELPRWAAADAHVVVDPPRAGLHPRVAEAVARGAWRSLVYVACGPASLGRDAAILAGGGWRLREIWPVDLFPQTGHTELVAAFTRG